LFPEGFTNQLKHLEENPDDKAAWGVLADWLREDDVNEPDLSSACRYIHRRDGVKVAKTDRKWDISGGDKPFNYATFTCYETYSLAGSVAAFAAEIRDFKKGLE
jgi:hypothetical protein